MPFNFLKTAKHSKIIKNPTKNLQKIQKYPEADNQAIRPAIFLHLPGANMQFKTPSTKIQQTKKIISQ
jgi:hypothetical protein